jgi:hypothetical protein
VLAEIARLLQTGGVTAHVIETDSEHPLTLLAKAQPELYRRYLIEPDGHVGLELVPAVIERFRRHGLEPIEAIPMETASFHPRLIVKWFRNEYAERNNEVARLVEQASAILASPPRLALTEIRLGVRQRLIGRREDPRRAQFLALACRKQAR